MIVGATAALPTRAIARRETMWSPGARAVTAAPTCSTTPAPSWPGAPGVYSLLSRIGEVSVADANAGDPHEDFVRPQGVESDFCQLEGLPGPAQRAAIAWII